jgi:signal transduction histidine kinase
VNPIEKLSDAATAIVEGDFDQRLKISRRDEVGRLINAFNEMTQKLRSHYDSLESKIADTNEKLATTDDELKRSREALARSEALIALGQLSAGIAHEIRTPLTSIKLFIQSLEDELPLDEEQSTGFAIIKGEIDRMEETVRRFLDFARTAEPKFELVNLKQIISDAISLVKTRIKGRGIVIETSEREPPPICGDKKQLTQVFLNLFLNSIEAMPDGGKITVSLHENENSLITVADTGCGIAPDELPYIFDPFFTTKETGTGMGLAIVYNAIEQHGGNIEVESQPQKGTKFTISLPRGMKSEE